MLIKTHKMKYLLILSAFFLFSCSSGQKHFYYIENETDCKCTNLDSITIKKNIRTEFKSADI